MVTGIENCIKSDDKGQSQIFTALLKSPEGNLCIALLKVNPFETDIQKSMSWEILGEVRSLSDEPIEIKSIV